MSDALLPVKPTDLTPLAPNRAPLALTFGLLSAFLVIPLALVELGMNGGSIIVSLNTGHSPLYLRVLALLPFWACIGLTFFFTFTNRRETPGALVSIVIGCLCAIFSIYCGFWLTKFALSS